MIRIKLYALYLMRKINLIFEQIGIRPVFQNRLQSRIEVYCTIKRKLINTYDEDRNIFNVTIQGVCLEQVHLFKYLGCAANVNKV